MPKLQDLFVLILATAGIVVLQAIVETDFATLQDWKSWGIGVGSSMIRAAATPALAFVVKLAAQEATD